MVQELAEKVAIVTGGASGIGRATAELYVEEGAKVVVADVQDELGQEVAAKLGDAAAFVHTDVADPDSIQNVIDFTVGHFGGLDVMFNNAGIPSHFGPFLDEPFEDFQRVMSVNLFGVMIGTQRAGRYMVDHGGGSIINTTSIAALNPGAGVLVYAATKISVIHFTKSIAIDLGPRGVRVNAIAPGLIPTAITSYDQAAVRKLIQPLNRAGTPRDVANAALYLGSDRAAQVTGQVMVVDGGASVGRPPGDTLQAANKQNLKRPGS